MNEKTKTRQFLVDANGTLHWKLTFTDADKEVYLTPQEVEDYGEKCSMCLVVGPEYVEVGISMYWEWKDVIVDDYEKDEDDYCNPRLAGSGVQPPDNHNDGYPYDHDPDDYPYDYD